MYIPGLLDVICSEEAQEHITSRFILLLSPTSSSNNPHHLS